MADIKQLKDQIWYIKRDIQNEEKKRDEWATTVRLPPTLAPTPVQLTLVPRSPASPPRLREWAPARTASNGRP
jgi:hypothetical protein